MASSRIVAAIDVVDGEVRAVSIIQERHGMDAAGLIDMAPRGLCRVLDWLRTVVRLECRRTAGGVPCTRS